jgi:hypothetical protein
VPLAPGVEYVRSTTVKDQIELSGNDIADVSNTAARISQACTVKRKDIRKFLDGIYVSEVRAQAYTHVCHECMCVSRHQCAHIVPCAGVRRLLRGGAVCALRVASVA